MADRLTDCARQHQPRLTLLTGSTVHVTVTMILLPLRFYDPLSEKSTMMVACRVIQVVLFLSVTGLDAFTPTLSVSRATGRRSTFLRSSSADEVAKLRAAAAKAREEAEKLSQVSPPSRVDHY